MVSGAVFADSFMSERLLSYEFIGPCLNIAGRLHLEEGVLHVAQIFRALQCCLENLQSFYATLSPSTTRPLFQSSPQPPLCPSCTYLSSSSPCNSAHQSTSSSTPRLPPYKAIGPAFVSFTALDRQEYSVEYIDRIAPYYPDLRVTVTEADTKDIWVAVAALHKKGLVLGDLRQPNVLLLPEGGVNLIDFDWCGKENTVTYPADIFLDTSSNDQHKGTQCHGLIKREHNAYMFECLTGSEFYLS